MEAHEKRNRWFCVLVVAVALFGAWFVFKPLCLLVKDAVDTALRSWGALPGIGYNLLRSLQLLGLVMLVITPISFGMALWMYALASPKALRRVRRWLDAFAMLPAVLLGLLGRVLLAPYLGNGMASMVVLMCLFLLPFLTVSFERVLQSAPPQMLEAGALLGAGKMAIAWNLVLPGIVWELARSCAKCVERILGEATALLVLLGAVPTGSVLSVELFRLAWIGRQDASLLALCLGGALVILRLATSKSWGTSPTRPVPRGIWQRD